MRRGCVAYDAVAWLERSLPGAGPPAAAAFVHILMPEFVDAWLHGTLHGHKGEDTCCPSCNTGLFDTLKCAHTRSRRPHGTANHTRLCRRVGVQAVYSGHDHDNDFAAEWQGVRLAYGCATCDSPTPHLLQPLTLLPFT